MEIYWGSQKRNGKYKPVKIEKMVYNSMLSQEDKCPNTIIVWIIQVNPTKLLTNPESQYRKNFFFQLFSIYINRKAGTKPKKTNHDMLYSGKQNPINRPDKILSSIFSSPIENFMIDIVTITNISNELITYLFLISDLISFLKIVYDVYIMDKFNNLSINSA